MRTLNKRFDSYRYPFLPALGGENQELIRAIRGQSQSFLREWKFASLATICLSIEKSYLPGIFIEAGCELCGSSILFAALKRADRPLLIYDVFGMIPFSTKEDTHVVQDH